MAQRRALLEGGCALGPGAGGSGPAAGAGGIFERTPDMIKAMIDTNLLGTVWSASALSALYASSPAPELRPQLPQGR